MENYSDVLIAGAGPCGLAVAARLCEQTPSALFTDEEHKRYHWMKKHAKKAAIKDRRTGQVRQPKPSTTACRNYSTVVLDGSGQEWMTRWNQLFSTFEISHLRSPLWFHPDPHDRDGLLSYAFEQGREEELVEIPGCVGKEISKHKKKRRINCRCGTKPPVTVDERERKDYFNPSSSLFRDYCECVIDRYGLRKDLVRQEHIEDIDFGHIPSISEDHDVFTVKTNKGIHYARSVVLAVGAGNVPSIPKGVTNGQGCCHAMQIKEFPDRTVKAKIVQRKQVNVVVVGGGLTSAQLTDMAIRRGVTKVWHLVRGRVKVKPFDVDLEWMGRFKNTEESRFWSADSDEERLEQIREARGGGSMTPRYHKILKQHMSTGKLSLHADTTIQSQSFEEGSWKIQTEPPIANLPQIDYIYYATGIASDFRSLPFLSTMNKKYPIDSHGGLPSLTNDLMWDKDIPLFMTGRLASLRLGPGAGNLAGARAGAERIAWAMEDVIPGQGQSDDEDDEDQELEYRYQTGQGGRYSVFGKMENQTESD